MIVKLKTWYKHYSIHGSCRAVLNFRLETDNINFRDRLSEAIQKALAEPPEKQKKNSVMGFHTNDGED